MGDLHEMIAETESQGVDLLRHKKDYDAMQNMNNGQLKIISFAELQKKEIPKVNWIIPELLTEGLCVLAGRPKEGKSFMALNLCLAVASGGFALGKFPLKGSRPTAIYIPMLGEGYLGQIKERASVMIEADKDGFWPENLLVVHDGFPPLTDEGDTCIENLLCEYPDTKLIVIDTLDKFINRRESDGKSGEDRKTGIIQQVALKYHVCIIAVHHVRKAASEEVLDKVSGTYGMISSAETIAVLYKKSGISILNIQGRNQPSCDFAVEFDFTTASWRITGDAAEKSLSKERQEIISLIKNCPMTPKEISDILHRTHGSIRKMLSIMAKENLIENIDGRYVAPEL